MTGAEKASSELGIWLSYAIGPHPRDGPQSCPVLSTEAHKAPGLEAWHSSTDLTHESKRALLEIHAWLSRELTGSSQSVEQVCVL